MKLNWATEEEAEPWEKVVIHNNVLGKHDMPALLGWLLDPDQTNGRYSYWSVSGCHAFCFAFENPASAFAFKIRWS